MLRSMTGFGQAAAAVAGVQYAVEVRSVNSRYFKASIRLPEPLSALEADIDRLLRERLHRGGVEYALRMRSASADAAYEVNMPALERYLEQVEIVRPEKSNVEMHVDLATLLLLPGVCTPPEPGELCRKVGPALLELTGKAVAGLLAMREQEGAGIVRDLTTNAAAIQARMTEIAGRAGQVVQDYHARLKKRVEELVASARIQLDQEDLAREVAVYAERCDVSEELSRLASHLAQLRTTMTEEQPGRKLDFIAQELLREANTIGSKANDAAIARAVVEIKTAIDRIKEQVQNVE